MWKRWGPFGPPVLLALSAATLPAGAQDLHGHNTYGLPGLIDMPSGLARPDAELSFSVSHFRNQTRSTLSFQATPRMTASLRYSNLYDIRAGGSSGDGSVFDFIFDRSFSLHYQVAEETERRPAIAIGLNDFLGTGIYSSEYIAATKTFGDLRVTGGLGWGRLGSYNGFTNPLGVFDESLETRDDVEFRGGGQITNVAFFSGDAAFFGGIEYQVNDRLWLMAEYSSDDYAPEDGTAFDQESPFNFGLSYQLNAYTNVSAHYLYGSELGAMVTFAINPKNPPNGSGLEAAPPLVTPASATTARWDMPEADLRRATANALEAEGLRLVGFDIRGTQARVEIVNTRYQRDEQAIGRTARILTGTLPGRIDSFTITPVRSGLRGTSATVTRATLETFEHDLDQAWESYARTQFDGTPAPLTPLPSAYPQLSTSIGPYFEEALFDPDDPLRFDIGLQVSARYEPAPGLVFSGQVRQKILGTLDESTRDSDSVLPRVRSESYLYDREGQTALTTLTGAYYFSPAPRVTGRVTAGYLEKMFAGVSGELLWSPENSPLSYGIEVNHVRQRDFDQGFGLQDYEVTTGHASLYWDMGAGYHAQVDAGRYLAGDWGATLTLDRRFENGWKVGAFATLTDVPFEDFGEGSFDKGIILSIPLGWGTGQADQRTLDRTVRSLMRDGGARLSVDGRLYEVTQGSDAEDYIAGWGRFWR